MNSYYIGHVTIAVLGFLILPPPTTPLSVFDLSGSSERTR